MKRNKTNKSFTLPKFPRGIGVIALIISTVLTDSEISHNFLCLNFLYGGIKYSILILIFALLYYLKRSLEISFIFSLLIWTILNWAAFSVMYNLAMENESFTTPPCEVTSYLKKEGKSGSYGMGYIYKGGGKHHLHYTSNQLDSLAAMEGNSQLRKIDLRLKLNKVCESIYYIKGFTVLIKKDM